MNIWMTLKKAASLYPDHVAVVDGSVSFTYRQINRRVESLARFLQSSGIRPGACIAVLDVNSHAFFETYYAAAGAGAILSPLNHRLSPRELAFIVRDAGASWLVAGTRFAALVESMLSEETPLKGVIWTGDVPPIRAKVLSWAYESVMASPAGSFQPAPVAENDIAHLYYTSGTTGQPKGVMLTHKNVCLHALGAIAELALTDADVWGHIAAMFHLADAWATFAVTWVGGRHVMVPDFDPVAVMSVMEKERITLSNLIPTMLNLMIKHPRANTFDFSSLRLILSGGAPIAPELVGKIIETFHCDYIQTYGLTETSPYVTVSILNEAIKALPAAEQLRYKSKTGRPFITVELKVADPQGNPVAADDQAVGEIWVRGDTVTPGYWNRPEETRKAFSQEWLKTGDLAVIDGKGYVNIVDRKKDMIISGGENVYSIEVENVLYRHAKVLEAAVFGVPDPKWGEAVMAAVVLKPGETVSEGEIIRFCKEQQASYKAPKSIIFLPELPKTGSGKIFKKALRDPYWTDRKI
ncbi:MAG: long-chain-fatty-acid--CoA ligase [Desulfobacterales bacterium]|nr:long-chain-fatty-acid--CoA ligase [Desulfobacterales bacterium]